MSLRISSAVAVVLVAPACAQGGDVQAQAEEGAATIECAIGPGSDFGPDCLVERVSAGDAQLLVVRHPDGGFRRFAPLPDGAGLAAYDGADSVRQRLVGDTLVIEIAGDRYRFPARAKDHAAAQ